MKRCELGLKDVNAFISKLWVVNSGMQEISISEVVDLLKLTEGVNFCK